MPSFGVVPVFDAVMQLNSVPGIDINFAMVLHGEQQLEIHKPLPANEKVVNTGRIAGIYDKGKAALIVNEAVTTEEGGDKNPLHADPVFAKKGGFETPILHGLCSFGVVCKSVVDSALDGDVSRVAGYSTRFAGVVFPGETIQTSIWREDGQILISAKTVERDSPVMTNAVIRLR